MTTQTSTSQKTVYIQWSEQTKITKQFKSFDEFAKSDYLSIYANNFGYNHLVEREIASWSKYKVHNVFIVDADAKYNYGLDFKMFIHYTADGINFFSELTIGGKSINDNSLRRVMLTHKMPQDLNINDLQSNSKEIMQQWFDNMNNDIFESFCYSTNAFYRKGREFRPRLREMSKSPNFIFS